MENLYNKLFESTKNRYNISITQLGMNEFAIIRINKDHPFDIGFQELIDNNFIPQFIGTHNDKDELVVKYQEPKIEKAYFEDRIFKTQVANKLDYIVIEQNDTIAEKLNKVVIKKDLLDKLKTMNVREE